MRKEWWRKGGERKWSRGDKKKVERMGSGGRGRREVSKLNVQVEHFIC